MRDYTGSRRTVVFATHYLEEAQDFADRVVLMARGRIVADGSVAQVRAHAFGRTVHACVPGGSVALLAALPGVVEVTRRDDLFALRCNDSDAALRVLLQRWPEAYDIEVNAAGLEEAFVALVGA